ncbi:hypothetical protein C2845_PM14G10400 [Panicum miliaceum]|uniref:Uncharacterized protein n=1 Tax=Panicum miliaceum TaxID=4540 RepID=A0A3L6PSU0_PANMI|nr:hypothetical protein C2845_PM14G10400 [Panicum miliaceum]
MFGGRGAVIVHHLSMFMGLIIMLIWLLFLQLIHNLYLILLQNVSAGHDAVVTENGGGLAPLPAGGDGAAPISIPSDLDGAGAMSACLGNPPRSKVKSRKKENRFKKGMNAESKRKNKCRVCK